MIRPVILLTLLLAFSVLADNRQHSRVGNPRNYEVDILTDTFGFRQEDIDTDIDQVFQGCARRDCIPSIDQPKFIPADEVDFLDPDDLVLSLTHSGKTRAYPTRILDRHEIVNDRFGSTPIAVTYCPLCGSGLAFVREVNGTETEFGVSGLLHNNDLIMYDRKTESIWQQITGRSIAGPERGRELLSVPVSMHLWEDWKNSNPGGEALNPPRDAGQYTKHAYGDYATSDRLLFPVSIQDARLHAKKIIFGVDKGTQPVAVESEWLMKNGSWEHEINGQLIRVQMNEAGGVSGFMSGDEVPVHRMFWFAWYSFHPNTSLIDERSH